MKSKEIRDLGKEDINKKIEELKLELIKTRISAEKGGKAKVREIKKTLARLKTTKKNNTQTR